MKKLVLLVSALGISNFSFGMEGKYIIPDDELDNFVKQYSYTDFVSDGLSGQQIPNPISKSQWAVNTIDKFISSSISASVIKTIESDCRHIISDKETKLQSSKGTILKSVAP